MNFGYDNCAKQQGQMMGALGEKIAKAVPAPNPTLGEEIDQRINRLQGKLERVMLVKKKIADGGALAVTLNELQQVLSDY